VRKTRLFWQLFLSYLLVTLVSLLAVSLYGSGALRDLYHRRTAADLESRARLLQNRVGQLLTSARSADVDALCKELGGPSSTRITVVLPSGQVVGDSEGTPAEMDNHADRQEIADALAGSIHPVVRPSPTLKQEMMYVAIPVEFEGKTVGVLRTSIPMMEIDHAVSVTWWNTALGGSVVALLAAGISLLLTRRISQPLEQLRQGAERFAAGDLSEMLPVGQSQEVASLAETLNRMAAELDRRIRDAVSEQNQREAILSNMSHDVTRLRRLENVRSDFVANVSHELKTPITSIKGFVETLLDGAVHDPEDARRFLKIVAAQADRLNEIIEDLLTLSRLEGDTERAGISLQPGRIRDVLQAAAATCQLKATEKNVEIELTCDDGLRVEINAALLEQAVVNLVDNAVKYSPGGQTVHVEAAKTPAEIVIRVRDHGCGIGPDHLPRLFERFYRVDKARSRKLGGTGLGLAIVKHIAQAHGGRVTVESVPGEGSVFSVHLPS